MTANKYFSKCLYIATNSYEDTKLTIYRCLNWAHEDNLAFRKITFFRRKERYLYSDLNLQLTTKNAAFSWSSSRVEIWPQKMLKFVSKSAISSTLILKKQIEGEEASERGFSSLYLESRKKSLDKRTAVKLRVDSSSPAQRHTFPNLWHFVAPLVKELFRRLRAYFITFATQI